MQPIVVIICLLVLSFVVSFVTYRGEKKVSKQESAQKKKLVDDPQILFSEESKSDKQDESDIEII